MKKNFLYPILVLLFGVVSCKTAQQKNESKVTIKNEMLKALKWQEANPIGVKNNMKDWTNGAYYTGVVKAHQATNDKDYLNALEEMTVRNNSKPAERFFHADDVTICYPYVYLASIKSNKVDLKPTEAILKDHLYKEHPWRNGVAGTDNQSLWWWCDALFMAPPVLTSYAKLKNDTTYLDEMHKNYMATYNLLFDKKENLFARDLRFVWKGDESDKKEKNGNKIFWSRGNGWVIGGLALLLEDMPKDYKYRAFYEDLFVKMAKRIKEIQPESGMWTVSLLSPESFNHGEVSGSGFFTFALAWGINNGLLPKEEFKPAVLKAWAALEKCQQEDGKVGWVQNIGFDPRPASADSWQNYGTGAFLLAGSEILKLK